MTNKEYREHVGISKSNLFEMSKSPLHFKWKMEHPIKDTPALIFGRAAHKYILEKNDFFSEFCIMPNIDRRTKAGKEEFANFLELSVGRTPISVDDFDKIKAMAQQIDNNPLAKQLLTGKCETSWFWNDDVTNEPCKCRPDCLTEIDGHKIISDYKTTDSCQDGHFERSVRKYGYKLQAGMYCEGVFQNTLDQYDFYFVAQEKTEPYAVRVYKCSSDFIAQGYDQFRELIGLYHKCKTEDIWNGYNYNGMEVVELLADEIN